MFVVLLPALSGCDSLPTTNPQPERISGVWELHQDKLTDKQVDAVDFLLEKYPGCTWGRMTWDFQADHLEVALDLLCPAGVGDYYGCEVSVRVPATWDAAAGKLVVPHPVAARSRTVGIGEEAIGVPTSCEVAVAAGDYPVARVRNEDWRWEMAAPNGHV
ncbi:MAG: hypothetical protein ABMA64_38850, partial [Myxococcota bacterium]